MGNSWAATREAAVRREKRVNFILKGGQVDPNGIMQITFDGKQTTHLMRETEAEIMVPIHFDSWEHFTEHKEELLVVFEKESVQDKARWMVPGVKTSIV